MLHHQIYRPYLHHWIIQHLISATASLSSTATFSHSESSSLSYCTAQIPFSHQIIQYCRILCTALSVNFTIQVLPLMYPYSFQWDWLSFSLIYSALIFSLLSPLLCIRMSQIISTPPSISLCPFVHLSLFSTTKSDTLIYIFHHRPHTYAS